MTSRFVDIDGVTTHYIEKGNGIPIVLLHGGDFGGRAENSWGYNIDAFAEHYRVVAPDWLGYGQTDKIHDFLGTRRRMLMHMSRFLEVMKLKQSHFVGNSMGATLLVASVASGASIFQPRSMVLASGGGFVPDNEHRRALVSYDGTVEGMILMLKAIFSDPRWWTDEAYIKQRHAWSVEPGVWECCAAARFRAPYVAARNDFGQVDETPYENVKCPTLLIAGAEDKLRNPGYADDLRQRIPSSELIVFKETGHCPNIERASEFNTAVLGFLRRVDNA